MTQPDLALSDNPDLQVGPDQWPRWNSAPHRRHGFHNLHRLTRYAQCFRAAQVLDLRRSTDFALALRPDVARFTALPWFSALVVVRDNRVLLEAYAPDFGPDQPHSVMSISKTLMNLVIGNLWGAGKLDLEASVGSILPWIGAGYHRARLQDVLNMNVQNDYSEDYQDPNCSAFLHEAATGMRLPPKGSPEPLARDVLAQVGLAPGSTDTTNPFAHCLYKSANTDVLAAVVEAVTQRPMTQYLADIADAAGLEGALHVATDRSGFPMMNGGICLTARDLARIGLLHARRGAGVDGSQPGSAAFLDATLAGGVPMPSPREHLRYSNHFNTDGRWIGHGGYGGQYMVVDPRTGTVGVFLSVLDTESGYDPTYYPPLVEMLADICTS